MDKKIFILVLVYLAMAAQGSEGGDINKELNEIFYRFWTNKMGSKKFYDVKQKDAGKIASAIKQRGFDYKKEVKIIIHGYTRSAASIWKGFAKAYLAAKKTVNLFVVDWSKIAKLPRYEHASNSVDEVGGRICRHLIKAVLKAKSERRRIHIIGHGLGAYVAGHSVRCLEKKVVKKNCLKDCKKKCKKDSEKHCKEKCEKNGKKNGKKNCKKNCLKNGKKNCNKNCKRDYCNGIENVEEILLIGRITALDPDARGSNYDLTKNDTDVLDVIHTNGGSLYKGCIGKPYPFGHVDFFPNQNVLANRGGFKDQHVPGCDDKKYNHHRDLAYYYDSERSCSHEAAWKMYWESIRYPKSFESRQCEDWKGKRGFGFKVLFQTCNRLGGLTLHMGENIEMKTVNLLKLLTRTGDGRFFLTTTDGSNGRYSRSGL